MNGVTEMGDSGESTKERKKEFQRRMRQELTRNQRILLSLLDLVMIATLLTDIAYFLGFLKEPNLMYLALLNLAVVAVGYVSYKTKRIIGRRVAKEMFGMRKDEATVVDREHSEKGVSREEQETDKSNPRGA